MNCTRPLPRIMGMTKALIEKVKAKEEGRQKAGGAQRQGDREMGFPPWCAERLGRVEEPGIDILDRRQKSERCHRHDVVKQTARNEKLDIPSTIRRDAHASRDRPQGSRRAERELERVGAHQHAQEHQRDESADHDFAPARRQAPRDPIGERKCEERRP